MEKVLGSVYYKVSDDFMRGLYPIARTVKAEQHDLAVVVEVMEEKEVKQIGNIYGFDGGNYAGNVYDDEGIAPTIRANSGGNTQPMIVEKEVKAIAQRGRNPNNPSDRTAGSPTEQRLEVNHDGVANCLTSVQKDCMVLEKNYEMPGKNFNQRNTVHSPDGICRTIIGCSGSSGPGNEPKVIDTVQYRIRKLTPRECGRLMNCSDDDITRMIISSHDEAEQFFNDCEEKGIRHTTEEFKEAEKLQKMSNTQLYKRFGNAICIEPLMAMFRNLNIKGVKTWNEVLEERRSKNERRKELL